MQLAPETHAFLVGDTCYWHHEHEQCAHCGRWDKPDDPELPFHTHHDENADRLRQSWHPEEAARLWWAQGGRCEYITGWGWVPRTA